MGIVLVAAKLVLALGAVLLVVGAFMLLAGSGLYPRVPGDLSFRVGGVRVWLPLGTSVLLSILLTLLLNVLVRRS